MTSSVIDPAERRALLWGAFFLFTGVLAGAFGAHGLAKFLGARELATWETGVRYQLLHGLALLALARYHPPKVCGLIAAGVVLFSFNCQIWAVTGIKAFALVVPVGGTLLVVAWGLFFVRVLKGHP